jgi:hypothetical protein
MQLVITHQCVQIQKEIKFAPVLGRLGSARSWWAGWARARTDGTFTVLALTNSETLTCFVSEPNFRFSRCCLCAKHF